MISLDDVSGRSGPLRALDGRRPGLRTVLVGT